MPRVLQPVSFPLGHHSSTHSETTKGTLNFFPDMNSSCEDDCELEMEDCGAEKTAGRTQRGPNE